MIENLTYYGDTTTEFEHGRSYLAGYYIENGGIRINIGMWSFCYPNLKTFLQYWYPTNVQVSVGVSLN